MHLGQYLWGLHTFLQPCSSCHRFDCDESNLAAGSHLRSHDIRPRYFYLNWCETHPMSFPSYADIIATWALITTRRLLCKRLESIFLRSYAYEVIDQLELSRLQKCISLATVESISSTRVLPFKLHPVTGLYLIERRDNRDCLCTFNTQLTFIFSTSTQCPHLKRRSSWLTKLWCPSILCPFPPP